ncbi:hypothetical protein [Candidatus Methylobacter favarea]|uniref:hypothetical protein n=1 Tax=Candidatus Methylobacter favarea TaxID=2707345 RepID=UPI00157CC91A|nr:hypothetical protein [Candidatus Methylobacter favarea]
MAQNPSHERLYHLVLFALTRGVLAGIWTNRDATYPVNDDPANRIKDLLFGKASDCAMTAVNKRKFVEVVL